MHAFDDALIMKGRHGADGVLVAAGTFRGDSSYGPGKIDSVSGEKKVNLSGRPGDLGRHYGDLTFSRPDACRRIRWRNALENP